MIWEAHMVYDFRRVPAFVFGEDATFHAREDCVGDADARGARNQAVYWCSSAAAHMSCLRPCPTCATDLAVALTSAFGSIPSGDRARRPRPSLTLVRSATPAGSGERTEEDTPLPYGAPDDLEDVRFSARSRVDWGMAAYGQSPDEFLSESTDDDHEWRGGARYME